MKNIIAIDYNPGALGSLVLWALFKKCPELDRRQIGPRRWGYNNHHARPDIQAYNLEQARKITSVDLTPVCTLASHNMLTHLPASVVSQTSSLRIVNSRPDIGLVVFNFWYKAGQFMVDYVINNGQTFNLGMFKQLIRTIQDLNFTSLGDVVINFKDLGDVQLVNSALDTVILACNLEPIPLDNSWYQAEYCRSTELERLYPGHLAQFNLLTNWIYAHIMNGLDIDTICHCAQSEHNIWESFELLLGDFIKTLAVLNKLRGR